MQANSRSQGAGRDAPGEGSSSDGADRQSQLARQLRELQQELDTAQAKAAQAASYVSQYKAMAESSDQALKAMQVIIWLKRLCQSHSCCDLGVFSAVNLQFWGSLLSLSSSEAGSVEDTSYKPVELELDPFAILSNRVRQWRKPKRG